jgi:hypothetical protein
LACRCNRLQPLCDFDADKRTCAVRLEAHNARRREAKRRASARRASTLRARHLPPASPRQRVPAHAAVTHGSPTGGDDDASFEPGSCGAAADDANTAWRDPSVETEIAQLERALFDDSLFDLGDFLGEELCGGGDGGAVAAGGAPVLAPSASLASPASLSSGGGAEGARERDVLDCGMASVAAARAAALACHAVHAQQAQAQAQQGVVMCSLVAAEPQLLTVSNAYEQAALAPAAAAAGAAAAFQAGYALAAIAAAAAATGMHGHTLHIKLLQHAAAAQVPLQLPGSFEHLYGGEAAALGGCIRPGCVLITLTALLRAPPRAPLTSPPDVLRRLFGGEWRSGGGGGSSDEAAAAFLMAQPAITVRSCGGEASYTSPSLRGRVVADADVPPDAPRPPMLSPLALLSSSSSAPITLSYDGACPPGATHGCRLASGRVLPLRVEAGAVAASLTRVTLAQCGEEGVALFEVVPPGVPLHHAGRARPVLLCRDAAIVAEVAAAGDATAALCAAAPGGAAALAARAHIEHVVTVLGAALRPEASAEVIHAAACASLWLGWPHALSRLLAMPQLRDAHTPARFLALLAHASAATPHREVMRVLTAAATAPLARGAALAASLLAAAAEEGHTHGAHALHAAAQVLARRRAAAPTHNADEAAAAALLAAAAAALDARELAADSAAASQEALCALSVAGASRPLQTASLQNPTTAAAAAPADFHAFAAERASDVRSAVLYLLLTLSLDVLGALRRIAVKRVGPLDASELMLIPELTQNDIYRAFFINHSWTCLPLTAALLTLLLAPWARARAWYVRHHTALLSVHWAIHFILNHVIFEQYIRVWWAVPRGMARMPRWWTLGQVNITFSSLIVPIRATPLCALLALRTAMPFLPERWSVWPLGRALDDGGVVTHARTQLVMCAVAAAVLQAMERREVRAWRAARAAAELRTAKQL